MGVTTPSEINARFADGFNRRDVDALVALYDTDGSVVEPDGSVARGVDAIRAHLERLLTIGGEMESTNRTSVVVGDTALVTATWQIRGGSSGADLEGNSAEVLCRQPDGTWAYLIDQPLTS